jgi:hypothetical protein
MCRLLTKTVAEHSRPLGTIFIPFSMRKAQVSLRGILRIIRCSSALTWNGRSRGAINR